jgi:hypothetical protein
MQIAMPLSTRATRHATALRIRARHLLSGPPVFHGRRRTAGGDARRSTSLPLRATTERLQPRLVGAAHWRPSHSDDVVAWVTPALPPLSEEQPLRPLDVIGHEGELREGAVQ